MTTANLQQTLQDAMKLMQTGDLNAATAAIQAGLQQPQPLHRPNPDRSGPSGRFFDGQFRRAADDAAVPPVGDRGESNGTATEAPVAQVFHTGTFDCAHGSRDYRVYAPGEQGDKRSPVLLMLHGCTQDAAEFARGTRMHLRAASEGYIVVYPAQSRSANPNGCWNWFRAADQRRGSGEPAILAAMVSEMTQRFGGDADRVYVAGLSAGGAMAVTLGRLYPDVFRAVGAHSGLAHASAHDVPSALAAMRSGARLVPRGDDDAASAEFLPTIVFHGDRDHTVNVGNAARVVEAAQESGQNSEANGNLQEWSQSSASGVVAGGHAYTTTTLRDASGQVRAESWIVHGGGHAWFGGSPDGSYTDPLGPDATGEMLRFFRSVSQPL